jgi:hypothetical protein
MISRSPHHSLRILSFFAAPLLLCCTLPTLADPPLPAAVPAVQNHPPAPVLNVGCSWFPTPFSQASNSPGYIDVNASYFVATLPTSPTPDTQIIIEGQYPQVRYFSFETARAYSFFSAIDQIADAELIPEEGGVPNANPASIPNSNNYQDHYKITVLFQHPPKDHRPPNTVYVGESRADTPTPPQIVMRQYLPNANSGYSNLDPALLPTLTYVGPLGTIPLTATPDTTACATLQKEFSYLATQGGIFLNPLPASPVAFIAPVFYGSALPYPNQDTAYLESLTSAAYGDMVVVRVKVPTTPATAKNGRPPEVRYWSICQNYLHKTFAVDCLSDSDVVAADDGYTTIVISPTEKRPPLASTQYGYNWMAWGDQPSACSPIREILPAPNFKGSYQNSVDQWWLPLKVSLGSHAPEISYCDSATFNTYAPQGGLTLMKNCRAAHAAKYGHTGGDGG